MFRKLMIFVFLCCVLTITTQADTFELGIDGDLEYHNSVDSYEFTLTSSTNVEIWTDSYDDGLSFDPIISLWDSYGNIIVEDDDNPDIRPDVQTSRDSGISGLSLTAGTYTITIVSWPNWASGTTISDGFDCEEETPILITEYETFDGLLPESGYYHLNISGVDDATITPVPGAVLLGILGLSTAGIKLRRKSE